MEVLSTYHSLLRTMFFKKGHLQKTNYKSPSLSLMSNSARSLFFSLHPLLTKYCCRSVKHTSSLLLRALKSSKTFWRFVFTVSSFTTELTSNEMMMAVHTSEPLLQALWKFRYFLLFQSNSGHTLKVILQLSDYFSFPFYTAVRPCFPHKPMWLSSLQLCNYVTSLSICMPSKAPERTISIQKP